MRSEQWRARRRRYIQQWRDERFPMDDPDCKCGTVGCVNRASRAMGNGLCTSCTRKRAA